MRSPRRPNPMVVIHCESNGWRPVTSGPYGPRVAGNRILVTGSAGHLGEALVRVLRARGADVVGLDVLDSPFTTVLGSVGDRDVVGAALTGVDGVLHAATLHKPHVGSHERQAFVAARVTGALALVAED